MPIAPPKWILPERNFAAEVILQKELGLHQVVAALLAQRGITDPVQAERFLNPSLDHLHDPKLLPDYAQASHEILGAKERGELIYVHGDYDVDGVTSAAILHRFLTSIGANVETHVPHRMKEGYGIHHSAVEVAREKGAKVFLTCDCGISAYDRIEAAREAGMRVVVTDHHTVGSELPNAHAIVNPHRHDSKYPFAELSGAGVVFKLCAGLASDLGLPLDKYYRAFLDLAALGTVADVMPLQDENRIIAKFGLERLGDTNKVGLQALKEVAGVKLPLRAMDIGFKLGPRINAVGRLDDAGLALRLLLEKDPEIAKGLALEIDQFNLDRKEAQHKMIEEAVAIVESQALHEKYVITVAHPEWHSGIVGLVAGKLVERYNRPTFCFILDDAQGIYKGSARSIPGFNVYDAIQAHPNLMEGGGHAMAAGCSFRAEDFQKVATALDEYARSVLTLEDLVVSHYADLEVDASSVSFEMLDQLQQLEPFGNSNPEPILICRGINLLGINPTKNPAHVQLKLGSSQPGFIQAIAFNMGPRFAESRPGNAMDFLFQPQIDEYNGRRSVKWNIKDFAEA